MIYTNETTMPFGKYKGEKLADVPASYLLYLLEEGIRNGPMKTYIETNIDSLKEKDSKAKIQSNAFRLMYNSK